MKNVSMNGWFGGNLVSGLMAVTLAVAGAALTVRAEIAVKDGQKVAFLGDSITQQGWGEPAGYVHLVMAGLEANGIKATPVPAGIGGHKSNQMLERLQRDVLDKRPDWMTLSCGVNDVWHGARGIPLDEYKTNISAIIERCQAAGVKVVILTATVIGEELENDNNRKLAAYNEFLRALAKEKNCPLADLNAMFAQAIKASGKPGRVLTSDGVHMNPAGDRLMAQGILQAFGLDDAQLKKAQEAWLDIPGGATLRASYVAGKGKLLKASQKVTARQRDQLQALAAKENKSLEDWLNEAYAADAKAVVKPTGQYESFEDIYRAQKENEVQAQLQAKFAQRIREMLKK
jgi:lysophospholipase L1-like esterase